MEIIKTQKGLAQALDSLRLCGKTIGLVPTMGALHDGHASLVKRSVQENDVTVVSVFVNPTHQDTYPTVNLEARACGTPVITYDVGGSPESAGGKYIVKENDIDGLAEQIYKLTEREAVELSV